MIIARHVRVTGRVQGVFYRAWTREQANELGVSGWVRNCPDGSVEAHLEGDEKRIDTMLGRMEEGPIAAEVERIGHEDAEVTDGDGFSIRG